MGMNIVINPSQSIIERKRMTASPTEISLEERKWGEIL